MKLFEIPEDTVIRPPAAPRFFPGDARAVLLLHGYAGSAKALEYLGERIHESGCTVSIPRLPGHGTNAADFAQTSAEDWLRSAVDNYLELNRTHQQVAICGLSMGAVLALLLAARFRPAAIVALAPALVVQKRLFPMTRAARFFVKRVSKPYTPNEDEDADLQYLHEQYWSHHWIEQLAGLHRLIRLARTSLGRVSAPTLTIVSEQDQTVPVTVAGLIEEGIGAPINEYVLLSESGHVLSNDVERDRVADLTVEWFNRHLTIIPYSDPLAD